MCLVIKQLAWTRVGVDCPCISPVPAVSAGGVLSRHSIILTVAWTKGRAEGPPSCTQELLVPATQNLHQVEWLTCATQADAVRFGAAAAAAAAAAASSHLLPHVQVVAGGDSSCLLSRTLYSNTQLFQLLGTAAGSGGAGQRSSWQCLC